MDAERERSALVEALESLLDSPGWSLYEGRLRNALEKARADLETVASWEEYLERRGKLDMLKVVLGLPRRMLKEARAS
jgi:hypothetical protein